MREHTQEFTKIYIIVICSCSLIANLHMKTKGNTLAPLSALAAPHSQTLCLSFSPLHHIQYWRVSYGLQGDQTFCFLFFRFHARIRYHHWSTGNSEGRRTWAKSGLTTMYVMVMGKFRLLDFPARNLRSMRSANQPQNVIRSIPRCWYSPGKQLHDNVDV